MVRRNRRKNSITKLEFCGLLKKINKDGIERELYLDCFYDKTVTPNITSEINRMISSKDDELIEFYCDECKKYHSIIKIKVDKDFIDLIADSYLI